jgi:hypothetical protein
MKLGEESPVIEDDFISELKVCSRNSIDFSLNVREVLEKRISSSDDDLLESC